MDIIIWFLGALLLVLVSFLAMLARAFLRNDKYAETLLSMIARTTTPRSDLPEGKYLLVCEVWSRAHYFYFALVQSRDTGQFFSLAYQMPKEPFDASPAAIQPPEFTVSKQMPAV